MTLHSSLVSYVHVVHLLIWVFFARSCEKVFGMAFSLNFLFHLQWPTSFCCRRILLSNVSSKSAANITLDVLAVSCALPLLSKFFSVWDLLESNEEVFGWTSCSLDYSPMRNNAAYSAQKRDFLSCLHFVPI